AVTCTVIRLSAKPGARAQQEPLSIVTTIFPEYDFARAVAGDLAQITMLIKPGAESHSYEPTPMDILAIQKCDVFICVGGENDAWAQRILSGLDTTNMRIIRLMDIVEPEEAEEHHHHDHDHHDEHAHEYDEHVWTSPVNAMAIVSAIAQELSQADPANAASYEANAQAYNEQIRLVHEQIEEIVSRAVRTKLVFGDRFPFLYFAREYDLDWISAFPGCSTDSEASAATVAAMIDMVREEELPVVCHMELSSHRIADTICAETGAKCMQLHSCHNVTREEFEAGETYVSLMQKNCETLEEALCK
ncbi:MAG: metal ABC transporter substrate-binding protein, partial [Eubacteriales bacterium]|nr:metal ABC transporter substrate-binding protein [Eubacteriales bacterium]